MGRSVEEESKRCAVEAVSVPFPRLLQMGKEKGEGSADLLAEFSKAALTRLD